ncbi:MAG: transglutaminase-like domain-containing protein [Candidatus Eremiobacteraeota bacterium]|nr:transglutaminase-like domain-containing protein [Candidatus Eremiobacteraeota bacterium]
MKKFPVCALFFLITLFLPAFAAEKKAADPAALVKQAHESREKLFYTRAVELLDEARKLYRAQNNVTQFTALSREITDLQKVIVEYDSTEADLVRKCEKEKIPLSAAEIKSLVAADKLEYMTFDGGKKYFRDCLKNAFFRDPALGMRLKAMRESGKKFLAAYNPYIFNEYNDAGVQWFSPYYASKVFLGEGEVKLKKKHFPEKGVLRLWIPLPVTTGSQTDVALLRVSHPEYVKAVSDADAEMGCLYLEVPLPLKKKEMKIEVHYRFTGRAVRSAVSPDLVGTYDKDSSLYRHYTKSEGNCTVTPEIKAMAEKVAAGEQNPYLAARKLYDYVVDNVKYSFMPHLSLDALKKPESVYVFEHKYGDCGGQSILFAALCRSLGIPARCLGGMQLCPGQTSYHFWAQVFIPSYGWIPVDTSVAQGVMEAGGMSESQKQRIKDFFFGSIDPYRFYIQKETDLPLSPAKGSPRILTMAFQLAEGECAESELDPLFFMEYEAEFQEVR